MSDITIPDFDFSGFYYPEILEALIRYKRNNVPELTEENPYDPAIQLLRAFALVGHLNNVLLDACANETFLPTARLRASVKNQLKLIGYDLAGDIPSTAKLLADISQVIASTTLLIPRSSDFQTQETEELAAINFENIEDIEAMRSDQLYKCYGLMREENGADGEVDSNNPTYFDGSNDGVTWDTTIIGKVIKLSHSSIAGINGEFKVIGLLSSSLVELEGANFQTSTDGITWELRGFTIDYSAEANSAASSAFNPFLKGAISVPVANDAILISHRDLMHDQLDFDIVTGATGITGIWEYFSGEGWESAVPDNVDIVGSTNLRFYLNTFLNTTINVTGALIKVTSRKTGAYEYCFSKIYGGINVIETIGKLGQSAMSNDPNDYSIGAAWIPLPELTDGTISGGSSLGQDGAVVFSLPYGILSSWAKTTLNTFQAFWLRFRVISVSTPTSPSIERIQIDQGTQTLAFDVTQGITTPQDPLGSGTGLANQELLLNNVGVVGGTIRIWVDDQEWSPVDNFLNSISVSKHFRYETDQYGYVTIIFGDGINGAMPGTGVDNIRAEYRIGASNNGNVGADTIIINTAGIAQITNLRNPQPATGWIEEEGATDESLAKVKVSAPQILRTLSRAVATVDLETLALGWIASDGSKPIIRANAIEEEYGIKTIGLYVVGSYGYAISDDYIEELEEYFNGEEGVLILNHEATVKNYDAKTINVSATVYGGIQSDVENALEELLRPDALKENGIDFVWTFGGEIPLSRVYAAIHEVSGVTKVTDLKLNAAALDISLESKQLPKAGTFSITVI